MISVSRWSSFSRWSRPRDERGSISLFLVIALVGLMLGALLVPMVITSARTTRTTASRVQAIDIAQAGVDVLLGKIRAATDSAGAGDARQLPCAPTTSPFTGSVGTFDYSVTVDYFTVDPEATSGAIPMICVSGYGAYDATSGIGTPSYARITAVGTVGANVNGTTRGRTLISTYVLQTSNTNVSGGVIRIYPSPLVSATLCMDAGSATPAAGAAVYLKDCSTSLPPAGQQTFAYRTDLTLQLVSSVTTTYPTGLCLTTAAPPAANNPITLQACPADGVAPAYSQQWSFNDNGGYTASVSNSSSTGQLSSLCMGVAQQSAAQPVKLVDCGAGYVESPTQAWIPSPAVGAGAAVSPQWVNASEFGRCLDVTSGNVASDHLIDYPCKQNPYAASVTWNQKFTPPTLATGASSATGQFFTTHPSLGKYCLTSVSLLGGYVLVTPCVVNQVNQQWTVYGGSGALPYSKKYTILDNQGRCLGITDPVGVEKWSAIAIQTCTGSTSQKWNAAPNLTTPLLQNTRER